MTKTPDSLETLRARIAAFVAERDWDQFHSPKNLAMALSVDLPMSATARESGQAFDCTSGS